MTALRVPFVFISYSHADSQFASAFASRLHLAGIRYFRDTEEINWGDNIPDRIHDALEIATHLVVLISPGSEQSQWVAYEMGFGRGRGVTLVPYLLHPKMRIPGFLSNIRYLQGENEEAAFIESLTKSDTDVQSKRRQATAKPSEKADSSSDATKEGLKKIRSKHPQVRADGLEELVAHKAAPELTALLGHSDSEIRRVAAIGVARLKYTPALPYLIDGLRVTGRRRKHELIPNVEDLLSSYGSMAFDPIVSRIPPSFSYSDGEERWVKALANTVDKLQAVRLLKECESSGRGVFLKAAIASGHNLPKNELSASIAAYLAVPHNSSGRTNVAKWLSKSKMVPSPWLKKLLKEWVAVGVKTFDPKAEWGQSNITELINAAVDIGAVSIDDVPVLAGETGNRKLSQEILAVSEKRRKETPNRVRMPVSGHPPQTT